MVDLLINGQDAFAAYGVRMGDNFLNALGAPASMKGLIENESRSKHGKQVLVSSARVASRQITLEFTIKGNTPLDFNEKKSAFYSMLYRCELTICVPVNSPDVYHLIYLGVSPTYDQSLDRSFCRVSVKFEEPNPTDRT